MLAAEMRQQGDTRGYKENRSHAAGHDAMIARTDLHPLAEKIEKMRS